MRSALVMVVAMFVLAACGPRVIAAPHSLPQGLQLGLVRLPRVWVAGFVASRDANLDLSDETARLLRQRIRPFTVAGVVEANTVPLVSEKIFSDRDYWQRLGEEYGYPLILTGSVRLLIAPAIMVQRGRRTTYVHATGRVLKATAVLIDGRTGMVVGRTVLPQQVRYANGRRTTTDLYYELMEGSMTDWLRAISAGVPPQNAESGGGL